MIWLIYVWIALAIAGLVFAVAARQNAADELKHLDAGITNGRRRLGKGHVRDETYIIVIDLVWLAIGFVYLATGNEPSSPLFLVPLVFTNGLLSLSTLMRWQDRLYASRPHEDADEARDLAEDKFMGDHRRDMERRHDEDRER